MVDFAGWDMPVQYSSIVAEHLCIRSTVGLFDISHMGRLEFRGAGAEHLLSLVLTNDVTKLKIGDIRYSLICRQDGGILDDVLIYRLPNRWLLVVNASNREKIVNWLHQQSGFGEAGFADLTLSTGMIAVQGPLAQTLVSQAVGEDLSGMKYYAGRECEICGTGGLVSRTGYTGEDGFELVLPASHAEQVWLWLLNHGGDAGILPAGLGCRDTLRLEAAMPLYGHELSETTDPLTAGLAFAVRLSKPQFTGRQALVAIQAAGLTSARVGLILEGRRIAREETPVLADGQPVGRVTSGTFSPTLQKSIAMAYVSSAYSAIGTELQLDLRGSLTSAVVTPLPFYRRAGSGAG